MSLGPEQRLRWFRHIALAGALLAACVIVLGAWVRLTAAGLGCPDWPGCYGHAYPQPGHEFGKALREMIHRYAAGTLALLITTLAVWAAVNRRDRGQPLAAVFALFCIVLAQAALGALTVTQLLKPLIVTGHLLGGMTTLGLLWWLSRTPERRTPTDGERSLRPFALVALAVLIMQIALGGWTSTNYAAVACPDLPTCQGSWWPQMDYRDAFRPSHGPGVDYEGGVLAHPARVAVHFTHRLGAVAAGTWLLLTGLLTWVRARAPTLRRAGALLGITVLFQISIGIATVRWGVPLAVATLHNAGAALLVVATVTLLRALWPAADRAVVP
jgi:cytochrome c oxidase assembly protein subunit 15